MRLLSALTSEQKLLGLTTLGVVAVMGSSVVLPHAVQAARWLWKGLSRRWGLGRWGLAGEGVVIGPVTILDESRKRHTLIMGATGKGKTVATEHLLYRDLIRGHGALIIDPKGERDFYDRVRSYCRSIGREEDLHLLSATHLEESARWNPLRLGNVSELQSKFYCASKYEHSFYAKATELALGVAFEALSKKHLPTLTLIDLVGELDVLSSKGKDENLKGLYFDIQNLATGEWAPILGTKPKRGNPTEISLLNITRNNQILFVDLPTEGKNVQSARIGSLLLQEVTLLSGIRKRMPGVKSSKPFSVYVDEFDAFATEPFVTFLNKGRSSDFMIHMAHQTLSDLKKVSPTFLGQIMGNPNVFIVFGLNMPDDAEMLAKFFGTQGASKRTHQIQDGTFTGMGSERAVQEFKIHPDTIKELGVGQCVICIRNEKRLEIVQMPPLTPKNLPKVTLPVHRGKLGDAVIYENKAPLAEAADAYAEVLKSKGDRV
jgi:conjugal transfer pilus assembly protein TraD